MDAAGIALGHHDGEGVGGVFDDAGELAGFFHGADGAGAGLEDVGTDVEAEVAEGEGIVVGDLAAEDAGRQGFVVDVALELGVLLLKGGDQLGEDEELIAADEEDEFGVAGVAVDVRDVVDVGDVEDVSLRGGIVGSFGPGWSLLGKGEGGGCNEEEEQRRE